MEFNFLEHLAFHIVRNGQYSDLPDIAVIGLREGYDTPALVILAGLDKNESSFVMNDYFEKAIQELELAEVLSGKKRAALLLVRGLRNRILKREIDVCDGCYFIFHKILSFTDIRILDQKFTYDGIGLAEVYGIYDTIGELKNSSMNWSENKTNEQLMEEEEERLMAALSGWNG
ncbi:hypothetical protein [Chitinophaga sp. Cy-1792]|uniref:hypothetical protein n=1 Tax=Chitinophaga sp. Cy-1792 TaxID=2608339 RepID=UPI00142057D0|nr:hypothetical protein [Chitinophaga sp. Cy-1792]NIG54877.1 hypothetical protein [Chitinophaga sp. Cy-1792]